MRIAICDDEMIQLQMLKEYVNEWITMNNYSIEVSGFTSANQLWMLEENSEKIDIYLLDIQMEGMNGMQLAQKIRAQNERSMIIFVSAVSDYIFDGFNVQALNYLLKPVKKEQLFTCLKKAYQTLQCEEEFICLISGKESRRFCVNRISFVESLGHYVDIYYGDEVVHLKMNLSQLEELLSGYKFMKPHRSFLVNLAHVTSIRKKEIIMDNKQLIPIARGKWEEVNAQFIQFHKLEGNI